MKTKEKKELFSKTIAELKLLLKEAENALFTLRMEHAKRKLKNTRSIFQKRKDIAKILSVIRGKEFEIKSTTGTTSITSTKGSSNVEKIDRSIKVEKGD